MDDLISRQMLLEYIHGEPVGRLLCDKYNLDGLIEQLPPAQPEIIQCKDCEYWDTTWQNDYAPNYHYCPMIDGTRRNDFYCAYAERREETT